jgi:hypothetical protein
VQGRGKNKGSHLANLRPWGVGGRVKRVWRTFLHSQECGNEEGSGMGQGERDSGKGASGALRGHYGFMHNVEMSGSGF